MLEYAGLVALGLAVGAMGTAVGTGGGFLLVPVLLFVYPERDADTVTAMSLLVVSANAISGTAAYAYQRRIDLRSGAGFALATLPGTVLGVLVVRALPRDAFEGVFAALLLAVGAYLLVPRRGLTAIREPLRGPGVVRRTIRDRGGQTFVFAYRRLLALEVSAAVGFVSSLFGIGGGIVHVPAMVTLLRFPVHIATATSQFVLAITAIEGTALHYGAGSLGWDAALAQAATLAVGAAMGAQVGARAAYRVQGPLLLRGLGIALLVVAARLGLDSAGR